VTADLAPDHSTRARVRVRPAVPYARYASAFACWASVLVVVVMWLDGGGLHALRGAPADTLTAAGRLVGLVASDLLLVQVLLMARVPVIERGYGQDDLARRHRFVGFWSFNLLVLHVVLVTAGYASAERTDPVHEIWTLVTAYPGMLLAAAGVAALTLVAATSIRVARRRLRYESWHLLHLYAYLGVGLALPHQIWAGRDFASSTAARVYWWTAYAAVAGCVLVFRLGLPLWRTLRHGISVTAVVRESADVVTVRMGGRGLHRLRAQAGQYFVWRFLDGPGWSRGHPYSLSAGPRHDQVQITAKERGDDAGRLARLRPGTWVLIEGPYGRNTARRRVGHKVALFACGIGIAPMRALLEDLPYSPGDAVLVYRARSEPDLVFRAELDALALKRGAVVHYLVGGRVPDRPSWLPAGATGAGDREMVLRLVPDLLDCDVFVCGPELWMDAVCAAALDAGLTPDRLHRERFAW
jgi:predicted ferric reductase